MPTLTIDNQVSPRIITVDKPDTQITIQELVDLLRDWEDDSINADDPEIVSAAGKEDLGGGVFVGISATLQNAQLAFEARIDPIESGTITTANGNGRTLTDTSATFQTNNVGRGDLVYNVTDGSQCTVISVDSEVQLTTTQLIGGTENDYDFADSYVVYDVEQCNVSGGNLVAVNESQENINVIFPTFGTQVVRTSSSSATLQSQAQLEYNTFNNKVTVDTNIGVAGTEYPIGTPGVPVNNLVDANTILQARGLKKIFFNDDYVFTGSEDFSSGVTFEGLSPLTVLITLNSNSNVNNCVFRNVSVTGILDNGNMLEKCFISMLTSFDGELISCGLSQGITLGGSGQTSIINCYSKVAGAATPYLDLTSGSSVVMREWIGGIELRNKVGADPISIDMSSGQVIIDSSCTGGTVLVRGSGKVTDNSVGTIVVDDTETLKLKEVYQIHGLDQSNPMTVTTTNRNVGNISQTISGDGTTTSTVTRT
jgi:hypothetical protein